MISERVSTLFRTTWEDVLASGPPAMAVGDIKQVEHADFMRQIAAGDPAFVGDLVRSIYAGDVYIFLNAYPPEALRQLKDAAYQWAGSQPAQEPKLVDGVTDYRSRRDWHAEEKGGYSSTYDMLHFYRWNGDPLGLFAMFAGQYELLRVISGFAPDAVASNRPSDG